MIITSPQDMQNFWKELSQKHKIILLNWELAAGKTLLTKWFTQWLWMDPNIVQSPTYTYINIYWNKVLHIDMYRLESFDDLVEKWILDHISQFEYILIERPKYINQLDLDEYLELEIKKLPNNKREITIKK